MKKVIHNQKRFYTAVFEKDEELGGYTATIPVLPGCISEGDTFEEAVKNIEEAAALFIEVMEENHEDIPQEGGVVVAPVQVTT